MKNILAILKELGFELTDEQQTQIDAQVKENYKTIADYEKQKEKLDSAEDKLRITEESLSKFNDINVDEMKSTIDALKSDIQAKETEFQTKLAERDFNDVLKETITSAKGKNAKAIQALLDMDALKSSKNQKDDIAAAIKTLQESEDSKFLFGVDEPTQTGVGSVIGKVQTSATDTFDAQMRAAAGLPPIKQE